MLPDFLERTWISFWWTRGIIFVLSICTLGAEILDLSRYEILTVLYAATLEWRNILQFLGKLVAYIPFLPAIPEQVIGSILFGIAVVSPVSSRLTDMQTGRHTIPTFRVHVKAIPYLIMFISSFFLIKQRWNLRTAIRWTNVNYRFDQRKSRNNKKIKKMKRLSEIANAFMSSAFVYLAFYAAFFTLSSKHNLNYISNYSILNLIIDQKILFYTLITFSSYLFLLALSMLSISVGMAFYHNAPWRRGVTHCLLILATINIAYFLGDPVLGQAIKDWSLSTIQENMRPP